MPQLMQSNAKQIRVGDDVPAFGIVKMHVAGERFGIGRRGIKGMRQNSTGAILFIGRGLDPSKTWLSPKGVAGLRGAGVL